MLSSLVVGLKANEKLDILYKTELSGYIPKWSIPKLKDFVKNEWEPEVEEYYYITSVTLNRLTYQKFQKLESSQKINGTGFAIGNDLYSSVSTKNITYEVWLQMIPLSLYKNPDIAHQGVTVEDLEAVEKELTASEFVAAINDSKLLQSFYREKKIDSSTYTAMIQKINNTQRDFSNMNYTTSPQN